LDKQGDINSIIQESIETKKRLLSNESLKDQIYEIIDALVDCFQKHGKVLFCGNGGSAADAQHLAAEFSGRFYYDRPPLFAEALHVNTSYLTAVANDYSYEETYSRLVQAKGKKGDVLIAMSTSGNSANIVNAIKTANDRGLTTVGMTGSNGGKISNICDILFKAPSNDTPRVQEVHMLVGHIICQLVEAQLFPKNQE
jgi:D-sedoheptulose 7-phosphate isomerase